MPFRQLAFCNVVLANGDPENPGNFESAMCILRVVSPLNIALLCRRLSGLITGGIGTRGPVGPGVSVLPNRTSRTSPRSVGLSRAQFVTVASFG